MSRSPFDITFCSHNDTTCTCGKALSPSSSHIPTLGWDHSSSRCTLLLLRYKEGHKDFKAFWRTYHLPQMFDPQSKACCLNTLQILLCKMGTNIFLYIFLYIHFIFLEQEVSGNLGKKVWRMDDRRKTGFKAMQEIGLNKAMDFMKT